MAEQSARPVKSGDGQVRRRRADAFEALQEEFLRRWDQVWPFGPGQPRRPWLPDTDIFEQGGNLVVKAELPGVKKEAVRVTIDGGDLVNHGTREAESEVCEEDYYRLERSTGGFYRRLPLAFEPPADKVQASFKDGVLEVRVPTPAEAKVAAKQIPVS